MYGIVLSCFAGLCLASMFCGFSRFCFSMFFIVLCVLCWFSCFGWSGSSYHPSSLSAIISLVCSAFAHGVVSNHCISIRLAHGSRSLLSWYIWMFGSFGREYPTLLRGSAFLFSGFQVSPVQANAAHVHQKILCLLDDCCSKSHIHYILLMLSLVVLVCLVLEVLVCHVCCFLLHVSLGYGFWVYVGGGSFLRFHVFGFYVYARLRSVHFWFHVLL